MISVSELRSGTAFEENGNIFQVLVFEHIKMGRGSGTVKVKVKNLRTGSITEKGFITGARVQDITLLKKKYQYLYADATACVFMNSETFEQISIPTAKITYEKQYLKEGMEVSILFFDNEPLSVDLPIKMKFSIVDTGAGVRGNTQSNVFKDATLDCGLNVKVPLFINVGDEVIVDTRTGGYIERAS